MSARESEAGEGMILAAEWKQNKFISTLKGLNKNKCHSLINKKSAIVRKSLYWKRNKTLQDMRLLEK